MPDRILRQGILSSDRVNLLSWPAEVFYRRLMSVADDYGRYDARVPILRAYLYPLKQDRVSESDVAKWLGEGSKAGLIRIYQVDKKDYLEILDFNQRLRAMKSKYPAPDNIGGHPRADDSRLRPESEAESKTDSETETKQKNGPDGQVLEKGDKKKKGEIISPVLQEIEIYFLSTIGNTKKNNPWPEDRCRNTAANFFDHYTANGWVQGKGKPIIDWQAAARKWMRNSIEGTFEPAVTTSKKVITPAPKTRISEPVSKLDKRAMEINFLYERFLENQCTIISIEVLNYDFLKMNGRISFSDEQVAAIKAAAEQHMKQFSIEATEKNALFYMKKFGVLEYFKELKVNNKITVYEEPQ